MKQFLSIFLLSISFSLTSFSQGIYGEIEGGYNYPLGLFKSAAGFAGGVVYSGFHAGGAVGYTLNPTWSFGMRTIFIRNGVSEPNTITLDESPLWKSRSLLFSTKMSRQIIDNLHAELEAQAGYMWASFPFTYSLRLRLNPFEQGPQKSSGFIHGIRVGFKYYLTEKVAYKLSINYLKSNIDSSTNIQTLTQSVSLALLYFGVLIEL